MTTRNGQPDLPDTAAEPSVADLPMTAELSMQPIVDLDTRHVRGFEALRRFPEHAGWAPQTWFAEAETVGRGAELNASAIRSALRTRPLLPDGALMSVKHLCELPVPAAGDILEMVARSDSPQLVIVLTEHTRIDDYAARAARPASVIEVIRDNEVVHHVAARRPAVAHSVESVRRRAGVHRMAGRSCGP